MPFYPGPGVGGHCIPKDPLYLYWKAKHYGFRSRFIKLASDVISYMPEYVVERVVQLMAHKSQVFATKLGGSAKFCSGTSHKPQVLVIGVTYKKDVKDLRKSPALDIIDGFQKRKISVSYYDPLIPYLKLNHINLKSVGLNRKKLNAFDCVVIATDHSGVDYDFILKASRLIFDTRNVYRNISDKKIIKL